MSLFPRLDHITKKLCENLIPPIFTGTFQQIPLRPIVCPKIPFNVQEFLESSIGSASSCAWCNVMIFNSEPELTNIMYSCLPIHPFKHAVTMAWYSWGCTRFTSFGGNTY